MTLATKSRILLQSKREGFRRRVFCDLLPATLAFDFLPNLTLSRCDSTMHAGPSCHQIFTKVDWMIVVLNDPNQIVHIDNHDTATCSSIFATLDGELRHEVILSSSANLTACTPTALTSGKCQLDCMFQGESNMHQIVVTVLCRLRPPFAEGEFAVFWYQKPLFSGKSYCY